MRRTHTHCSLCESTVNCIGLSMTFVAAILVMSISVVKDIPVLFKDLLLTCATSEFLLIGAVVDGVKSHLYG